MDKVLHLLNKDDVQPLLLMGIRGISLVSKFVLTLFIARFMGFEVLGFYGLIVSATFIVPAVTSLGIMYMKSRNAVTQTPEEIVEMLYYYGRFIMLIYVALAFIVVPFGYFIGHFLLTTIIFLVVLFEHINNDFYGLLLNLSRPFVANILHFIRTSVWIFPFMILAFMYPSLQTIEMLLVSWVLGGGVTLFGFFWRKRHWPWGKLKALSPLRGWIKEEFKQSKIVYMDSLASTIKVYLNNFIIAFFLGLELTGVYVFFMQIIGAMSNLIQTGVIQVARPAMVRAYKMQDNLYHFIHIKCLKQTIFLAMIMSVLAAILIYPITLYLVDQPAIAEWFPVFWFLLIAYIIFMCRHANDLLFYSQHRDDLTLKLNLMAMVLGAVSSVVFIPLMGFWGIALAGLVVASTIITIQYRMVKQLKKENRG